MHNNNTKLFRRYKQDLSWQTSDVKTLYLTFIYDDYEDFVAKSEISDTPEHKEIFNTLFWVYGNVYLRYNTSDMASSNLRFQIEQKTLKYIKLKDAYDKSIDFFLGKIENIRQYRVGDVVDNNSNENKYKTTAQDKDDFDALANYNKMMSDLVSPLDGIIAELVNIIFLDVKVNQDDYEFESET